MLFIVYERSSELGSLGEVLRCARGFNVVIVGGFVVGVQVAYVGSVYGWEASCNQKG